MYALKYAITFTSKHYFTILFHLYFLCEFKKEGLMLFKRGDDDDDAAEILLFMQQNLFLKFLSNLFGTSNILDQKLKDSF